MYKNIAKRASFLRREESGFTLVELLIVVGIVVALAAASITSVIQFADKGEEGARSAEGDTIQAAMDTLMADSAVISVPANDLGTGSNGVNNVSSLPTGYDLTAYIRDNPTAYWYCWDATGKVLQLTSSAACPASPY